MPKILFRPLFVIVGDHIPNEGIHESPVILFTWSHSRKRHYMTSFHVISPISQKDDKLNDMLSCHPSIFLARVRGAIQNDTRCRGLLKCLQKIIYHP